MLSVSVDRPILDITSIRLMAEYLKELGIDASSALRAIGLDQASLSHVMLVSTRQEVAFQRSFAHLTSPRPSPELIWFSMGRKYRALSFGSLGTAWLTAENMTTTSNISRSASALTYTLALAEPKYDDGIAVGADNIYEHLPDDLARFTIFRDFGATSALLSDLWGSPFPFDAISLPEGQQQFASCVTGAIINPNRSILRWSKSVGSRRLPLADATLNRMYTKDYESRIDRDSLFFNAVQTVQRKIESGKHRNTTLEQIASDMALQSRTFQRRLADHGSNFRSVKQQAQRELACRWLLDGKSSIAEVAHRLGFSDVTAFTRFFKEAIGETPGQYQTKAHCVDSGD